jgi:hypothetical protein
MAMTDKQKGIMDELTDALSEATGGIMTGSFINEIKGLMAGMSTDTMMDKNIPVQQPNLFQVETDTNKGLGYTGEMSESEIGKYPDVGWTNMGDSPEVQQFLNNMPHADRVQVEGIRQRVNPDQFQNLMRQLMSGQVGSGALHEPLPFQQYNTGADTSSIQDLGFVNQQTANYSAGDRTYPDWMIEQLRNMTPNPPFLEEEIKDIGIPGYKQVVPRGYG